jgi:hypothetical protein
MAVLTVAAVRLSLDVVLEDRRRDLVQAELVQCGVADGRRRRLDRRSGP